MMHHQSGDYFSADGTGALVWQWIGELKSHDQIVQALQAGFPHSSADIAAALDAFLADLLKHGLIRETAAGDDSSPIAMAQVYRTRRRIRAARTACVFGHARSAAAGPDPRRGGCIGLARAQAPSHKAVSTAWPADDGRAGILHISQNYCRPVQRAEIASAAVCVCGNNLVQFRWIREITPVEFTGRKNSAHDHAWRAYVRRAPAVGRRRNGHSSKHRWNVRSLPRRRWAPSSAGLRSPAPHCVSCSPATGWWNASCRRWLISR